MVALFQFTVVSLCLAAGPLQGRTQHDLQPFKNGGVVIEDGGYWLSTWSGRTRVPIKELSEWQVNSTCFDHRRRRVVFSDRDGDLRQLSLVDGKVSKLGLDKVGAFTMSPNGKQIAACRYGPGSESPNVLALWTERTGKVRILARDRRRATLTSPSFSADGQEVAYCTEIYPESRRSSYVTAIDLATSRKRYPFGRDPWNGRALFGKGREMVLEWYGSEERDIAIYVGRSSSSLVRLSGRRVEERLLAVDQRSGRIVFDKPY
ncbi:hypothetical protein EON81_27710, partial [bacterium]